MSFFDFSSFNFFSPLPLPLWKVLIDSFFAVLMWAVLVRFVIVGLFGDSRPRRTLHSYVKLTDIVFRLFKLVTPTVLTPAARSLYAAFLLFLLRYYGLPTINNYRVDSLANLPFEDYLAASLTTISHLISRTGS